MEWVPRSECTIVMIAWRFEVAGNAVGTADTNPAPSPHISPVGKKEAPNLV